MIIKRFTSMFLGMNSVFVSENDKDGLLVDPGVFPPELDKIKHYLERNGLTVQAVLYTHTHGDHISGWYAFNHLDTYGHEIIQEKNETERNNDLAFIQDLYSRSNFNYSELKFPEFSRLVQEGESVSIKDSEVSWYSVPGHSKDSTVIIFPRLQFMLSGDMLIHSSKPFILSSVEAYRHSLDKIEHLVDWFDVNQLAPGHAVFAHSQEEIMARIRTEKDYVEGLLEGYEQFRQLGLDQVEMENRLLEGGMVNGKIPYQHKVNVKKLLEEMQEEQ